MGKGWNERVKGGERVEGKGYGVVLRVGKGGVKGGTREEIWAEGIEWKWREGRVGLKV